jgi:hypothetical protein
MPDITDPLLQSWLDVYRALEALEAEPVTLNGFREVCAEPAWRFAVGARGPDAKRRQNPGPSPWLTFAKDQPANRVRELLPLWVADRELCATPLSVIESEVARDPMLKRRAQLGVVLMTHVVAHPVDWRWVRDLFEELHPRPLLRIDDDWTDDGDDDLTRDVGERPRRPRRAPAQREASSPSTSPPMPPPLPQPSSRPVLAWRRPTP